MYKNSDDPKFKYFMTIMMMIIYLYETGLGIRLDRKKQKKILISIHIFIFDCSLMELLFSLGRILKKNKLNKLFLLRNNDFHIKFSFFN